MKKRGISLLVVVALALILLIPKNTADTLPTQMTVEYHNIPPRLTKNIPDQYLVINTDKINAFDLDDYWIDNETLTYTVNYTSEKKVTVTIDSDNLVSFHPDADFNGTTNITFIAYDGFTTTTSNIVQIIVTADTDPPKWSNPVITYPITTIYQNTFVNFSVYWTDDFALGNYVFMINEGPGWISQTAETFSGTQNVSRSRAQISSSGGIVYWKVGAYDASGNYNETDVQNFTVATLPTPPSGGGATPTPPGEPQYGEGYAPAAPPGPKEQITGFTVTPTSINTELKVGSSIIITLKITNIGTTNLTFTSSISGLSILNQTISETEFNITAGDSKIINVMFGASETTPIDIYLGNIIIASQTETAEIPTAITVRPVITNINLDLKVLEKYKQVRPGKLVKANITLENLAETESKSMTLYYALLDYVGNVLDSKTETIDFQERSRSFEKELTVPQNAPRGEYIFFARITGEKNTNIDSDTFFVGSKFTLLGFIKTNLLILLIIVSSIIVALLMVKHYRNQERLRLLNLYIMITNLKKLLKENNLEEAIKLYVRIKASYGQPISRSALQNKEELKKEMEKLTNKLHSSDAIEALKKEAEEEIPNGSEKSQAKPVEAKEEKPVESKKEEPKKEPESEQKEEKPVESKKEEKKEEQNEQNKK